MKKMIGFGAVALCAAVGFAETTVQAPEIVGYQNVEARNGAKLIKGCQFQNTTGESIDIQSIEFKSNGKTPVSGCTLYWWNPNRIVGGVKYAGYEYAYWSNYYYDPIADDEFDRFCWVYYAEDDADEDYALLREKVFAPGEGFYANPVEANPTLTVAGAVFGSADTTSESRSIDFLINGAKLLAANPYPVSVDIQNIVFKSGNNIPVSGCTLYWWNPDRIVGGVKYAGYEYAYWSNYYYDPIADDEFDRFCWVYYAEDDADEDYALLREKTFAPGDGFYVNPVEANPKLFFPNPFKK